MPIFDNLQIQTGDLPRIEEVEFQGHSRNYLKLRLIRFGMFFLVLCIPWVGIFLNGEFRIGMFALSVWLFLVIFILIVEFKGFKIRGYALRERDLLYRKGLIFFSLTTVPFNRIQHSEISETPISRMLNLSVLKVYTAGGSSSDLSIPGLNKEEALRLKEYISGKVKDNV